METIRWSKVKNNRLKKTRGVSFEELLQAPLVAVKKHPGEEHQRLLLFLHHGYVWVVPCVLEDHGGLFLKTLYPSRKVTKSYREGRL